MKLQIAFPVSWASRAAWRGVSSFIAIFSLAAMPSLDAQDASAVAAIDALADERVRAAVRAIFQSAAASGIPIAPLVTKLREGIAKHAEPERIRNATAMLATRLENAASALAPSRSPDELGAGADALQAGVAMGTLRDMRRVWPVKSLTVPLGVLVELVSSGVPKAAATRRVRELLVQGATTTQLAALGTNVRADIAAGLAPDASMELRSKGVLSMLIQQNTAASSAASPTRPPGRPRP